MLIESDLLILTNHGKNHPALQTWITQENWEVIASWYDQNSQASIKELVSYLSLQDRVNFFSYINFQDWYSQFCQKLIEEDVELVFGYNLNQLKEISSQLLVDLIEYRLLSFTLQNLVTECFRRELFETVILLVVCLGSNRVFEPYTMLLYQVEFANYKRWQALNLALAPTAEDCENALA